MLGKYTNVLFLIAIIAVAIVYAQGSFVGDVSISVETNKAVYGSYEGVLVKVVVVSPSDLDGTLKVWGIRPGSFAHINQTKSVNLKKGENEFVFQAQTPKCTSGCGGVYPGPYQVVAELWIDGKPTVTNTTITLTT
ncbi:MAG: hypothetical protein ABIH90_02320 [Candidatus Aenigmatarchaeota archaeon]